MPNECGGSQYHPAYKKRELDENEILVDETLYTIFRVDEEEYQDAGELVVDAEELDGRGERYYEDDFGNLPAKVKKRIKKLFPNG